MIEGLVAYGINKFLGKYIHNLDSSNLNLSILQGDPELRDLQLKPEALSQLDLPIEVKAGYVGCIKLSIPWMSLFSSSVEIVIDEVYILAGPVADRDYDPEKERRLQNAQKKQKLEALEKSQFGKIADKAEEDPGLFEKLLTYVVNNIQVTIQNVHIRYEDTVTNVDHPFACGLILDSASAFTANSKWKRARVDSSATVIHKLVSLEELSMYWNPYIPEKKLVRSLLNTDGWKNVLKSSIHADRHRILDEELNFILKPFSSQTKVLLSKDNKLTLPKVFADVALEEIDIQLSRQQFLNVLRLQESFQMMKVNQRYRKYHPRVPLKVSPKSWWLYAYKAVLEEIIRPYSWDRIKEHRTKYRKYKDWYKRSLLHQEDESIKTKLWELEEDIDVANILIAREQAKIEFIKEAPQRLKKKTSSSWFSRLFGYGDSSDESYELEVHSQEKDWLAQLSDDEKQKLYKGIGYDINAHHTSYPIQYVAHKIQLNMKSCSISLVNYSKEILQVNVGHLLTTWENRPSANAFRISCNTESFCIEGASIEHDLVPIVTSDIGVYAPAVNQIFTFDFELKPLYVEADFSLKLNVQPVEIVYDEHSITELTAFFQLPSSTVDMRTACYETLQEVAVYSRAGLQYAIEQHKTIHASINMRSPYIVIPEYGTLHRGGNVLVLDFGTLRIESELQSRNQPLEEATRSEIESQLYDQFNIKFTDVKVLLSDSGDDWHTAQTQVDSQFHILPSVSVMMSFFNSIKPDYEDLPKHKFVFNLPTLKMNISDSRLQTVYSFYRNFLCNMPTSSSMATISGDLPDGMSLPPPLLNIEEAQLDPDIDQLHRMRHSILGRVFVDKTRKLKLPQEDTAHICNYSYTDYDAYFSASDASDEDLEQIKSFKVKPVDDNSSKSNHVTVLVRAILGEFVLQISKALDGQEMPYLMFRGNRLCVDAAVSPYGLTFHAVLGGIQLVDKVHTGHSGEYMELVHSPADSDLISISYRKVSPDCPDFQKIYHSVEQSASVKFSSLSVLFDQAAMMYLSLFIQGIISGIQNIEMRTSTCTVISLEESAERDLFRVAETVASFAQSVGDCKPGNIQLNMSVSVRELSLRLTDNDKALAVFHMKGFDGQATVKSTRMTLRCHIQDLDIDDLTIGCIHPHILKIEDDSLFDLKLVKYNNSKESQDNKKALPPLDYSIRLRVGQLQIVYMTKFYWDLIHFFEPFLNPDSLEAAKSSVTSTVESVQKQVEGFQAKNQRINVNIDIHAPKVLVPTHSQSTDLLLIMLGHLNVRNSFEETVISNEEKQEWNHFYLNLDNVKVQRVCLSLADDACDICSNIVEPISFKASAKMAVFPLVSDVKFDVFGKLVFIKINLLKKDLQVILEVFQKNFQEGAPQVKASVYTVPNNLPPQLTIDFPTPVVENREIISYLPTKSVTKGSFTFEGMSITLLNENLFPQPNCLLSQLNMGKVELSILQHSDSTIEASVSLQSITVDDVRTESNIAIKRIIQPLKARDPNVPPSPLVNLVYKVSGDGNQKVDFVIDKLRIHINMPYMMMLYDFFHDAFTSSTGNTDSGIALDILDDATETLSAGSLIVSGCLKYPSIVLFADPTDLESRVLVLHADGKFEYTSDVEKVQMSAKISCLQVLSCVYGRKDLGFNKIIPSCNVELNRTVNLESEQEEITANITRLDIQLSASVMKIFWDVWLMTQMQSASGKDERDSPVKEEYQALWNVNKVSSEKWLKNSETPFVSSKTLLVKPKELKQELKLKIEEVNAVFEAETIDSHIPILMIKTSVDMALSDWSNKYRVESELNLEMLYFNEKLSVWEPFIEPVMEQEGHYRPWEVQVKVIKAQSIPIACNYDDNGIDLNDGLQEEVQYLMHRARAKSSSSDDAETDSSTDMTVIRHRVFRKLRHGSERSYDSISHSSIQGESDSEPESYINNITNKLGSIFTSDSSDADISETDDNDDAFDTALDKPVFLTSRGPVQVSNDVVDTDYPDGADIVQPPPEDDSKSLCTYIMVDSEDQLNLNVNPTAINVLRDVSEALTQPGSSKLSAVKDLPSFEIRNELGIHAYFVLHSDVKVDKKHIYGATVYKAGENKENLKPITSSPEDCDKEEDVDDSLQRSDGLGFIDKVLAEAGQALISAGAFVFDDDADYLSGNSLDVERLKLQPDGFDPLPSLLHKRDCHRLLSLTPKQNNTKYFVVYDVNISHGRKVITLTSPVTVVNDLTVPVDIFCKTEELKKYPSSYMKASEEFTKIATIQPFKELNIPLYVAYHCPLYVSPSNLGYNRSSSSLWWQELVQSKEKHKYLSCSCETDNRKTFYIKMTYREGPVLNPEQMVSKTVPYCSIHLSPPAVLHNYLPYDIQFSLVNSEGTSSLVHGDKMPLYTVSLQRPHKLSIQMTDYFSNDWEGTVDISHSMEEFKAITMDTEHDIEETQQHLSLSIHSKENLSLDLYLYSPYWLVNKTELPIQLRGSMSDTVYDCSMSGLPVLFRYKKNKRKKARFRIYQSKWSRSFSLDTIGSAGVAVCYDRERKVKYMFLVQCQISRLKLTKIITILPFFLVSNKSSHPLRFMEEDEDSDLWYDLPVGKCMPFWPRTEVYKMFVKYEKSNVISQHFPIKKMHNTVLRMEEGKALCVGVTGGTDTPITIAFSDYDPGDAPVRVENLCEDLIIKIHQKNQSSAMLLSGNQSVLYTWDDPTSERTLLWSVCGGKKTSIPAQITKDSYGDMQMSVHMLRSKGKDCTDAPSSVHSSPDDEESDEADGLLIFASMNGSVIHQTRKDKMRIYWVSYLDGQQRCLLFTQDERVAKAARKAHVQGIDFPYERGHIEESTMIPCAMLYSLRRGGHVPNLSNAGCAVKYMVLFEIMTCEIKLVLVDAQRFSPGTPVSICKGPPDCI